MARVPYQAALPARTIGLTRLMDYRSKLRRERCPAVSSDERIQLLVPAWVSVKGPEGNSGDQPVNKINNLLTHKDPDLIPPFVGSNPATPANFQIQDFPRQAQVRGEPVDEGGSV
jgi:hypothetical protein